MLTAPNLTSFSWLVHGFGGRDSVYPPGISTLRQIHSAKVLEAPGIEATALNRDRFDEGDALIARGPGVLVGVRTADCVPILIADARNRAVAAVHAGWRGTDARIVAAAVNELTARYGSRPEDLHAAIGPAIGECCYEVGPEVALRFGTTGPKIHLAAINRCQLNDAGVDNVWQSEECTYCGAERYFSFRREKEQAGRMLSFIGAV